MNAGTPDAFGVPPATAVATLASTFTIPVMRTVR